ncbi:hypothetical protein TNCV_3023611 [Trichonephila clavipes]|nr:hypothetical protein TNCV_3023611 [Trichonephila clavipes]
MIPAYNKKRCAALPFETGIHFRRKTDFFPEEDTTKSYSGFEPTRFTSRSYTRDFGDGQRNFEPWSSDVDDTPRLTTTPTGGRFNSRQI